jgi:hypothetical protein
MEMDGDHVSVAVQIGTRAFADLGLSNHDHARSECTLKNLVMDVSASHSDGRAPQPRSVNCLRIATMTRRLRARFSGTHLRCGLQGRQRRLTSFAIWPNVAAQSRLGSTRPGSHVAHPPPLDQSRGDCVLGRIHELLRGRKCPRDTETWCRRSPGSSDCLAHRCPGLVSRTFGLH